MIILESRQMIDVFPDVAKRYLEFNNLKSQRKLRIWHVNELVEKMEKGLFRFGEIAFCKIKDEGIYVIVNGQHVIHAIIDYGKSVPCVVEKYIVDTPLEQSELFRQFEILVRSLPEMADVESEALKVPWPHWVRSAVISALAIDLYRKAGFSLHNKPSSTPSPDNRTISPSRLTKEIRVNNLKYYLKEGDFICDILTEGNPSETKRKNVRHLVKGSIVFMMMQTWRKNKDMARKFWIQVRDGEGLGKNDAAKALREFLIESSGRKYMIGYRVPSNHQYIYRIAVAWNAFIEGRKTSLRYRPELQPPPLMAWSNRTNNR